MTFQEQPGGFWPVRGCPEQQLILSRQSAAMEMGAARSEPCRALQDDRVGGVSLEGEGTGRCYLELAVTCRVLAGLGPCSLNKRWTINKDVTGARPFPQGLGLWLPSRSRWVGQMLGQKVGLWASPPPQRSRVTAGVRWARWVCGFWGQGLWLSPGGRH